MSHMKQSRKREPRHVAKASRYWTVAFGDAIRPDIVPLAGLRWTALRRAHEHFGGQKPFGPNELHWQRARRKGWRLVKVRLNEVK